MEDRGGLGEVLCGDATGLTQDRGVGKLGDEDVDDDGMHILSQEGPARW